MGALWVKQKGRTDKDDTVKHVHTDKVYIYA